MFYMSEEFYSMEQKLNASFCLFQPFGKIKIAGSYNANQHLIYAYHNAILFKILALTLTLTPTS